MEDMLIGSLILLAFVVIWAVSRAGKQNQSPVDHLKQHPGDVDTRSFGLQNSTPEILESASRSAVKLAIPVPYGNTSLLKERLNARVKELDGHYFFSKIAGVTKPNPGGRRRQTLIRELSAGEELRLVPEPENKFDANAVRIENSGGEQLGFLQASIAADAAPAMRKGKAWHCYVSEVTGWDQKTLGVNIALFWYDPVFAARPEREFERWISDVAKKCGGFWKYASVVGVTKLNEDGSDRQTLIRNLSHKEQLKLAPDDNDRDNSSVVHLLNAEGQMIAKLGKQQSRAVIDLAIQGHRWTAFFRDFTVDEKGSVKPHIALVQLGKDASDAFAAKQFTSEADN